MVSAFRVAALLGAMGGASALLVSAATPAKAGEEHLHNSSTKVYGLIPPGEGSRNATSSGSIRSASTDTGTTTMKSGAKRGSGGSTADNEPKIEDPPLPGYDGPPDGGNTMASNENAANGFN